MSLAREQSEAAADRIRGELERTLSELDRRRHAALDVRAQLRDHPGALWLAGGVVAVVVAGVVALSIARTRSRPERLRRRRREALERPAQSPFVQMGSKVAAATLAAVGVQLSKRAVRYVMSQAENPKG